MSDEVSLFAVDYIYNGDTLRQGELRSEHRAYLAQLHEQKSIVLSGPASMPDERGALIIIRAQSAEQVEELLDDDPFCRAGLIEKRRIRQWSLVFGEI